MKWLLLCLFCASLAQADSVGPTREVLFDDIKPEQLRNEDICIDIVCGFRVYLNDESIFSCNWCTDINPLDFRRTVREAKRTKQKLRFVKVTKTIPGKIWDSYEDFYQLEISGTAEPSEDTAVNSSRDSKRRKSEIRALDNGQHSLPTK